ncbi:3-oxoacyl-[acyl-carrier-protein] reductase FabG [compost metagenome]
MDLGYAGKVVLVTGAGHGIGKGIAKAFAQEGAKVAVNYAHDAEAADGVVAEIRARGGMAIAIRADVSDAQAVQAMVERVERELGPLDVLVNNAGVVRRGSLPAITPEMWDEVVDVNLKGTFLCAQAAAAGMVARQRGVIVNVSSMRGIEGSASSMHYAAAKAGVIALTKSLARELAPHVRSVGVAPGYVDTRIQAGLSAEQRKAVEDGTPLRRFGTVEDIASAVLFLASERASYVTGQTLLVDGGRVMC